MPTAEEYLTEAEEALRLHEYYKKGGVPSYAESLLRRASAYAEVAQAKARVEENKRKVVEYGTVTGRFSVKEDTAPTPEALEGLGITVGEKVDDFDEHPAWPF